MQKRDELTDPKSCLSRAREDEQIFVLLARDVATPDAIRFWAQMRVELGKNEPDDPQITQALEDADFIERDLKRNLKNAAERHPDNVQPRPTAPAWLRRAAAEVGITPEQRDALLHAMAQQFPVDPLLIAVVNGVEASIAESEGEGSMAADSGYGELVAVNVVLGIGKALLGDYVEVPRPIRPRETIRIPAGTSLLVHAPLRVDRIYLEPGGELRAHPADVDLTTLCAGEDLEVFVEEDRGRVSAKVREKVRDRGTGDPANPDVSPRPNVAG